MAALLVAVTFVGACAARQQTTPITPPLAVATLRVGIAPIYPPLAFKRDGKIVGVEAQFARKLGPALGTEISVVELSWDDLVPALRERRIDIIMSGMSISQARADLVGFAHPYLRVGQMMVFRSADAKRLRDQTAINKPRTRVGFVAGSAGEVYVRDQLSDAKPKSFESADAAVTALRSSGIDVFVDDAASIWRITAPENDATHELVGRYEPLTKEYLAWATRTDDIQLLARLNTVLGKWNADGTLNRVLSKWVEIRGATSRPPRQ
jgi:polar amino acid transport system substrate-binding protein